MYHEQETNQRVIYQATAFSALMRKVYIWMTLARIGSYSTLLCPEQQYHVYSHVVILFTLDDYDSRNSLGDYSDCANPKDVIRNSWTYVHSL